MKYLWIKVLFLSIISMCFVGCGGDTGGVYTTSVSFMDGEDEGTLVFDVLQGICTAATATAPAVYEDYTDALAIITLTVAEGMPGLTINSYSLEYYPLPSVLNSTTTVIPPTIESYSGNENGSYNIHVDSDSSTEFAITCFSTSQKKAFAEDPIWSAIINPITNERQWYTARYTIRIVLHCTDDSGYDRDIEVRRTVYLDNYDNC